MRRLPARWTNRFDAVVNLFTSFGFFLQPSDDDRVVAQWSRVLKPGGMLIWHGGNRDGVMRRFLARDWWLADDYTMIGHERSFDVLSGVLTVRSTWRGKRSSGEREHRIRLYSATHLAEIFARHGLVVESAYDGWTDRPLSRKSGEMLLVARKE
jgi:SAM-dependent methyltransferase